MVILLGTLCYAGACSFALQFQHKVLAGSLFLPPRPGGEQPTSSVKDVQITPHFGQSSHTSNLNIGACPVATLSGVWLHRVSPTAGWPGVSIL